MNESTQVWRFKKMAKAIMKLDDYHEQVKMIEAMHKETKPSIGQPLQDLLKKDLG